MLKYEWSYDVQLKALIQQLTQVNNNLFHTSVPIYLPYVQVSDEDENGSTDTTI